MSQKQTDFRRETRDTIVKSGLTGVAATVLAVALSSPAGLGGMVGTSLASGAGSDPAAENPYANLPPYPAPLTATEVAQIRGQLAATAASLALTREATDDVIAHIREIASTGQSGALTPPPAAAAPMLRIDLSDFEADADAIEPVTYSNTATAPTANSAELPDANLELASLLFSYDNL